MNPRRRHDRRPAPAEAWPLPIERHYRLRWPGLIYIVVVLFLALGAFNSQNNLLFFAFGLGVAGVIVSGFISGTALMGVRVRREPASNLRTGADRPVRYAVTNRNSLAPLFGLVIEELATPEHAPAPRPDPQPLRALPAAVAHCGPGQVVTATGTLRGLATGHATLDRLRISTGFPFGLFVKSVVFSQPADLPVLPARLDLRPEALRAVSAGRTGRGSERPRPGDGPDFVAVREYAVGDPLRSISWKRSAGRDTLVVRQTEQPQPPRAWVHLAEDLDLLTPARRERALALAAGVARALLTRGHAVGLASTSGVLTRPLAGRAQADAIDRALADTRSSNHPRFPHTTHHHTRAAEARVLIGAASALPGSLALDPDALPRLATTTLPPELTSDTTPAPSPPRRRLLPRLVIRKEAPDPAAAPATPPAERQVRP
jgi:uncharacterized protein (DUF58 family)